MSFCIRASPTNDPFLASAEILLGEEKERFSLVTKLWTCEEYESQWKQALAALSDRQVESCILITDIQSQEDSFGLMYWALFKEGEAVYFQERFIRDEPECLLGSPEEIEPYIPPRRQGTLEENALVSEWTVSLDQVDEFVNCFRNQC